MWKFLYQWVCKPTVCAAIGRCVVGTLSYFGVDPVEWWEIAMSVNFSPELIEFMNWLVGLILCIVFLYVMSFWEKRQTRKEPKILKNEEQSEPYPSLNSSTPVLKTTKTEQKDIFLAFVSIHNKVTNYERFANCESELNKRYAFLRAYETIFEASDIKQDYRDFMHSAAIAIDNGKKYIDEDEKGFVLNLISTSFKNLEKALK